MKNKFDLLVSEKEPFIFIEYGSLVMKDGQLISLSEQGLRVIPVNSIQLLYLGAGTSITQPAMIYCAKHQLNVCFNKGEFNSYTMFFSGKYQCPISLNEQMRKHNEDKLEIAKVLMKKRMEREGVDREYLNKTLESKNHESLLGHEGAWAKKVYRSYFEDFRRKYEKGDEINKRLSILNNLLYNYISTLIINCNLSPSIGFIHGRTRRGGLTFDIADLYKKELTIDLAFNHLDLSFKEILIEFGKRLRKDNKKKVKEMVNVCKYISGKESEIKWLY